MSLAYLASRGLAERMCCRVSDFAFGAANLIRFSLLLAAISISAAAFSLHPIAANADEGLPIDEGVVADETAPPSRIYRVAPSEDLLDVQVTLHKSETVRLGLPFSEALVGNAEVADVIPLTDRSIYIVGKQIGVTRLALLDNNKQLLGVVDVEVTYDLDGLRSRMRGNPAMDGILVQSVNGKILLTGTVPDSVAMQQAVLLAKQISPDEVTNAMKVASPQQVMLEVRFIEANRSASKAIGIETSTVGDDVSAFTGINGLVGGITSGIITNSTPFGALAASLTAGDQSIDIVIKALEERGLARRLAEPNLVALSGDTASFLAGGEFPFPAAARDDEITVEFKKFGVGLAFTPTVLASGQINLKIEPEVSDIDPTNFIEVAPDVRIPSLVVRRASTTVELRDGQSFAIAGLLQSNHSRSQEQLPWLGDVPVLGALMRSSAWQKEETDLVIIITPRLVKPIAPGQKLATPLENTIPTNEKEYFLTGRQEYKANKPDEYLGHIIDWTEEAPVDEGWKGTIQ